MADHREPNLDGNGLSYFQKTVILRDWWLIKCSKEFEGKRFGVAGTEITASVDERRAMRVFISSPIIKAYDLFTLEASNGICIVLQGVLNKERVVKSGFNLEISHEFIFGFPPRWERICNKCFKGVPLSNDINNTVLPSIIIDKARYSVLSPYKNTKGNVEDSGDERRKSLRLRSKSGEEETKLENHSNSNDEDDDHGSEGFDKVNESEVFDINEVISPVKDVDNVDESRSRSGNEESMVDDESRSRSGNEESEEERKGEEKVKKELDKKRSKSRKERDIISIVTETSKLEISNKDGRSGGFRKSLRLRSKSCEKVSEDDETNLESSKVEKKALPSLVAGHSPELVQGLFAVENRSTTNDGDDDHGSEGFDHVESKVKEAEQNLSGAKTKRKIDFDLVEVTPDQEAKMRNNTDTASIGSFKRSRSGRLLVSPLEFWRNQIPVYDMDRNLVEVKDGDEISSDFRKPKKMKNQRN